MTPSIATVIFAVGILGLFVLDRDQKARTSNALWIPVVWLSIVASRPVSLWLQVTPPLDSPDQYLEGSPLDGGVFTVLLVIGLIVLASRGQRVGALLRGNGPILLFFLYCAASILWSDYPVVASKRWIKLLGDYMMVLIVLTDTDPSAAVKRFLAPGLLLIPLSILLIGYYPELGRVYSTWTFVPMLSGVTTGKNYLGMTCMIFGLASLWRVLQELQGGEGRRRVGPLIAHGAVLAMVLWLLAHANSVTSFSCFVLAGGLMVVTGTTALARRPGTVHLLVAGVLSVSLVAMFLDAGTALETLGRDPTLTGRTALWKQVLSMTANPLMGTGFESFWLGERLEELWNIYWWHPNQAHNGYLEVFLNLGWIGGALLAVVLVTGYRNAVGAFRRDWREGSLTLAYFVAAAIFNLTEAAFKMTNPMWIAFLLAATSVSKAPVGEDANIPYPIRVRPGQWRADPPATKTRTYEGVV